VRVRVTLLVDPHSHTTASSSSTFTHSKLALRFTNDLSALVAIY
jgi:hypothetical protein